MELAAPSLTQTSTGNSSADIVISLSKLNAPLEVIIPDSADIPAENDVYAILGNDEENPDWLGAKVQAGRWNDATEEPERALGLKVYVSKKELERYENNTVVLRYQTSGESSMTATSHALKLHITA
ncbi:hypothetical protein ACQR3P_24650 [Rhodococcus sp. IEGM1300]